MYVWADGLYVKAGLEATKAALLVVVWRPDHRAKSRACCGERTAGIEGIVGGRAPGFPRAGAEAWRCTIADGHLGLWAALAEQQPAAAEQRCWNHRIPNVLDAMPKKHQAEARTLLCAMPYAESQALCEELRTQFTKRYCQLFPKAVERLADDWERLVTFYQFPREHWRHLRTTNVVVVSVRRGAAAHASGQTLQEGRLRHGPHLEAAASG